MPTSITRAWIAFVALSPCLAAQSGGADDGTARSPRIRNVLFLIADDLRADVLGCYGDTRCETPNLDRLARASTVFRHAYCQAPSCAPSRPSFLFGRYGPSRIDKSKHRSFPHVLRENGWYSARVGKVFHMRVPGDIVAGTDGRDDPRSWSERFNCAGPEESTPGLYQCLSTNDIKRTLEDRQGAGTKHRMYVAVQADGDGDDQPDHLAASKAVELLREHGDEPFALAVGFVRPHYPHVAPATLFDGYPHARIDLPETRADDWDDIPKAGLARKTTASTGLARYPDNPKRMWSAYLASVTFMDRQVGRILDELERLGLSDSTAVIFTSDHGYHLGDHDFWEKQNLHEQVTRVPLLIATPGREGAVADGVVELTDLYPTVMDLVGLPTPESCEGVSLLPVLDDPKVEVRTHAFTFLGPRPYRRFAIRSKRWAYLQYADGAELYDMAADPGQFTNLADDPDHADVVAASRGVVDRRAAVFAK